MPRVFNNKNLWGAQGQNIDQQRSDLFKVVLDLPSFVGGQNVWTEHVEFAVEKFPFPERSREMIPIKFLNQTNYQIGAESPTGQVDIPVRYAFNQPTMQILEKWNYLISNPRTGGVGLSSLVKCMGHFYWLIPDDVTQGAVETVTSSGMKTGASYVLEGCWIKGLKFSDADMTSRDGVVTATFSLVVDRYYPENLSDPNLFV